MITLFDSRIFTRYGGGYDLAARRKNATRESTATLKVFLITIVIFAILTFTITTTTTVMINHWHPFDQAWLNEHKKNPYPTKGEKIMLAIITKMTLTQVWKKINGHWVNGQRWMGKVWNWFWNRGQFWASYVCQTQAGEVKQLFEPLVKTFVDSP